MGIKDKLTDKLIIDTTEVPIDIFFGYNTKQKDTQILLEIKKTYPTKYNINNDTLIGIEVEVENILCRADCAPIWKHKEDGSLRNYGVEYISQPIQAQYIPSVLFYLHRKLKRENVPLYTPRTSIHVHINVQDMSFKQIQAFTILYLCFESLLYEYAGKNRNKSIFCVPLSHAGYVKFLMDFFHYKDNRNRHFMSFFYDWHKYTGFNLNPISTLGTIEFRHLSGTDDVEYISKWVSIILALKEASLVYKVEDLFKVIAELNTNSEYYIFASNIFKDSLQFFPNINTLQEIMEKDISHIKECFFQKKKIEIDADIFEESYFYTRHKIQKLKKEEFNYNEYSIVELERQLTKLYKMHLISNKKEDKEKIKLEYTKIYSILVEKKKTIAALENEKLW